MAKNEAGVPIGTVAERTGVSATVLRSWEQRYGFPVPMRNHGGHRRYSEVDIDRIRDVRRARDDGRSLERAIELVVRPEPTDRSLFAGIRRLRPDLRAQDLSRPAMLALSHAIEDECAARTSRPVLLAAFQDDAAYGRSAARWHELARTSARTVVLVGSERPRVEHENLLKVGVSRSSPVRREWAVVCDAPELTACLVGWERLGVAGAGGPPFEAVWTVDPQVVREVARLGFVLAEADEPEEWSGIAPAPGPDATAEWAVAIANRTIAAFAAG